MTAYEARVAGDRRVAAVCEPVPGGVRLRTPQLPDIRDYNGVVLGPGAEVAVDPDVRRINAFDPIGEIPPGWACLRLLVMGHFGPPPAAPPEVTEVDGGLLVEARTAVLRSFGLEDDILPQLLEMQARQARAGRVFAVVDDGRPLGWAPVIEGLVDDVWVDPTARRQGLGRALSRAAMAAGGRHLTVEPDNAAAVDLYRSLGFRDTGTLLHLTRG